MPTIRRDKYGWVKVALAEAGKEQKDLAKAWGVGPAPVSRWIASGEPKLSFERAEILARMLKMSLPELQARLAGGTPPRSGAVARAVARREAPVVPAAPSPEGILGAIKEMEAVAARVQATLPPGLKVVFSIEKE
jgi:hypothetical protein